MSSFPEAGGGTEETDLQLPAVAAYNESVLFTVRMNLRSRGMRRYIWTALLSCAALLASTFTTSAAAQAPDGLPAYDALAAGADAYWYHEAQRRRDIDRQLGLVDQMKSYAALPPYYDHTIYYRGAPYYRSAPSLEYMYGAGGLGHFDSYRERVWFGTGNIFEPWPLVPGDIWGYPFFNPVPQPIGQRHIQTGPNRWESHPVYAPGEEPYPSRAPIAEPAIPRDGAGGPREF